MYAELQTFISYIHNYSYLMPYSDEQRGQEMLLERRNVECGIFAVVDRELWCENCARKDYLHDDDCGVCRRKVRSNDNGIKCNGCKIWFHTGYEGVKQEG